MKMLIKINQMLLRLAVLAMLVMGVMVWMGNASLVNGHIGLGFIFTLLVLLQAVLGGIAGGGWGLAGLTALWGVLLPVIGLGQRSIMVGDAHWVVRVFHMLFSLTTMAFVERSPNARSERPAA